MADEPFSLPSSGGGILDPNGPLSFVLGGGDLGNATLEQIKRRRAVAAAIASQKRGYPKTFGEGLTALGDAAGDIIGERRLSAQELEFEKNVAATRASAGMPGRPAPIPGNIPPSVRTQVGAPPAAAPAAAPSPLPPGPVGPMTNAAPPPGSRDAIALADVQRQARLAQAPPVAQGGPPENPTLAGPQAPTTDMPVPPTGDPGGQPPNPVQLASLNPTTTMSDAPPPGFAATVENPPTPTDIQPMPTRVAGPATAPADVQAPPVGADAAPQGVPRPLDAPTPLKAPPSVGRTVLPQDYNKPLVKPVLPDPAEITEYETRGYQMLQSRYADDPRVQLSAKQLIDYGQKQREAINARNAEIFKGDLSTYEKEMLARGAFQRDEPKTEAELREKELKLRAENQKAERQQRLGDIPDSVYTEAIKESAKDAKNIPTAIMSINNARRSLNDNNMFTGQPANTQMSLNKMMAFLGQPVDPRVDATETFKSYMAGVVAQARQALVGGAQISNADLAAAEKAAAGDITFERGSINAVLSSLERINLANAAAHQERILAYTGNDPDMQRGMFGLYGVKGLENVIPQAAVDRLKANANNPEHLKMFDDAYSTPGLARRVLMNRR